MVQYYCIVCDLFVIKSGLCNNECIVREGPYDIVDLYLNTLVLNQLIRARRCAILWGSSKVKETREEPWLIGNPGGDSFYFGLGRNIKPKAYLKSYNI